MSKIVIKDEFILIYYYSTFPVSSHNIKIYNIVNTDFKRDIVAEFASISVKVK